MIKIFCWGFNREITTLGARFKRNWGCTGKARCNRGAVIIIIVGLADVA